MKQPLSYIHPNAKIAKNVVIEPFTSIDGDVEIGEGSWIGSNVSVMDGARIEVAWIYQQLLLLMGIN